MADIRNFACDVNPDTDYAQVYRAALGNGRIAVAASEGKLSSRRCAFLTAEQAREMAAHLNDLAEQIDPTPAPAAPRPTDVVFNGRAFSLTVDDRNFFKLDNVAGMGGAFMFGDTAAKLGEALVERFGVKTKQSKPKTPASYASLGDQARMVLQHMRRAGSISAREAMNDHGITSATLARRICDIEECGYTVRRDRRQHPITGKRYTRYSVAES